MIVDFLVLSSKEKLVKIIIGPLEWEHGNMMS